MRFTVALLACLCSAQANSQQIFEGRAFKLPPGKARSPFTVDPVQRQIVLGRKVEPTDRAGWGAIMANPQGPFEDARLSGGYVHTTVFSRTAKTVLLEAQGHSAVYVNGELRAGDPYSYGFLALPIRIKKGANELLFVCGRGRLAAKMTELKDWVLLKQDDATLPDVLYGEREPLYAGVVVVNATDKPLKGLRMTSKSNLTGGAKLETPLPAVPPMSLRKVPVRFAVPGGSLPDRLEYDFRLITPAGNQADSKRFTIRVQKPQEIHKRTFISAIDGSVQYYAVNPAKNQYWQNALIVTLHGAGVEALGQVESYAQKDWATIVAPTNRRPFGFDWEDWGRLDMFEVIAHAAKTYPHSPERISLTGHSMGGHGAWINAALFPDKWSAVGPSAGWPSFWTYGGAWHPAEPTAVETVLRQAMNASDTQALARNLFQSKLFVLHGDADDNVPVEQARNMRELLRSYGLEFVYYEQPGAGHWWDTNGDGAECVDFAPMFELFKAARTPTHPITMDFTTVNPALSGRCHWLTIVQQEVSMLPSRVTVRGPSNNVLPMSTENVRRMRFDDLSPQLWGLILEIDGQRVPLQQTYKAPVQLLKSAGKWVIREAPVSNDKGPERGGQFKSAFTRNFMLVYGTGGTAEENDWAERKARYDAETFYYRGNGSLDVMSDTDFVSRSTQNRDVVLYGNSNTNRAWQRLLGDSPVRVESGRVTVGRRSVAGGDLACLFVRPRKGSKTALVGAVAATGLTGMRLLERVPYFTSGIAYPDWCVFSPEVLEKGPPAALGAGFYANDWGIEGGLSAWLFEPAVDR